jgi:hypothetical protein|tara:strand:+ start:217 stop:321 length:105 start_codon:yes stop_codon:yes gene_type:complete
MVTKCWVTELLAKEIAKKILKEKEKKQKNECSTK